MESIKYVFSSQQESVGASKHARKTLAGEPGKEGRAQKTAEIFVQSTRLYTFRSYVRKSYFTNTILLSLLKKLLRSAGIYQQLSSHEQLFIGNAPLTSLFGLAVYALHTAPFLQGWISCITCTNLPVCTLLCKKTPTVFFNCRCIPGRKWTCPKAG